MKDQAQVVEHLQKFANGFLVLLLLSEIAVFIYGLSVFGTRPEWSRIILFVSGPLILATGSLFLLSADNRLNAVVAVFSISAGIIAVNLVLEITRAGNTAENTAAELRLTLVQAAEAAGAEYDKRDKIEVITDLRERGQIAYPSAITQLIIDNYLADDDIREFRRLHHFVPDLEKIVDLDALLPLSGISNVTTVFCNEGGEWSIYHSDRYGFNNDDTVYDSEVGGRVLLVGDSFTHGACLQPGEDVASKLRQQGYNSISLGMSGSGPLLELATLKEYGPRLEPDIVLWMYFQSNDLDDLRAEYRLPILRRYYLEDDFSQGLINRQQEIDVFWKKIVNAVEEKVREDIDRQQTINPQRRGMSLQRLIKLYNVRSLIGLTSGDYEGPKTIAALISAKAIEEQDLIIRFKSVLSKAKAEATRMGSKLYSVYLPSSPSVIERRIPPDHATIMAVTEELNIPTIDFYKVMTADADPPRFFPFRHSGHYNADGYALLADLIVKEALEK